MALPVVSSVVNKLGDLAIQQSLSLWGLHDKVDQLRRELQAILSFLEDTDIKQKHDAMVKNWVREIREITYDAEDIIDDFILEFERHRCRPRLLSHHFICRKIEDINARIEEIAYRISDLSIGNTGSSLMYHGLQVWRCSQTHIDDDVVVGFEHHAQILLERLLDPQTHRRAISVVGVGGIGKTTLAAKVFKELSTLRHGGLSQSIQPKSFRNEPEVRNAFGVCVWVSVTHDHEIEDVLVDLIRDVRNKKNFVESPHISKKSRSELVDELFQLLTGTSYLIVMDDLWRKDIWDQIKAALPDDNNGSRVILTTRSIEIANHVDSDSNPYHFQPLSYVESQELLLRKVFGNPSFLSTELENLSWQLSRKCGGLPLALVVLGGLLSGKEKHPVVWLNLVKNMTWESTKDGNQCLEVLAFGYNDLPFYLKSCFLYFSAFPQGYEIHASKLIQLWTAEGLIVQEAGRTMEETAEDYLEELIQRCLIQASKRESSQRVKRIRVHDLLLELLISEARECRFFHVKDTLTLDLAARVEQEVRRLSLHQLSPYDASQASITLNGITKLRTLLVFPKGRMLKKRTDIFLGLRSCDPILLSRKNGPTRSLFKPIEMGLIQIAKSHFQLSSPPSIIAYKSSSNFELMTVLDLAGMQNLDELPQEIEAMTHLKYLNLQGTKLYELPRALTKLKLHTLNIRGTRIVRLPDSFWKLETLRHLYLNDIVYYPTGLVGFIKLQTLDGVWIEMSLPELINLRKLRAAFASNIDTLDSLRQMVHLISLKLSSVEISSDIFAAISVHQKLQKLRLSGKLSRTQLPNNIEFPRYLTKLTLNNLELTEDPMPQLERLSSLRILKLLDAAYVGWDMNCSAGRFPRLHRLDLSSLPFLSDWRVEQGAMPILTHLTIEKCGSLLMLPEGLFRIVTLQELHLKCTDLIVDRVRRGVGEDWYKIAHVPSITITNSIGSTYRV